MYGIAVLVGGFTLIALATIALAGGADRPQDPLAPYADVLPGHERSAVIARGFACQLTNDTTVELCAYNVATGAYSDIYATVDKDAISSMNFVVRGGLLHVGDLPASWGRPQVRVDGQFLYLSWLGSDVNAMSLSSDGRFNYFLPLLRLSFADRDSQNRPRRAG